jgi:hypothetical protein
MLINIHFRWHWIVMWVVGCSRHSHSNTTVFCCRQLLALKRAAWYQPMMQTWSARCVEKYVGCSYTFFADVLEAGLRHNRCGRLKAPVAWGSTLDTCTPYLRTFWGPVCYTTGAVDSKRPLHEGARWILVRLLCGCFGSQLAMLVVL